MLYFKAISRAERTYPIFINYLSYTTLNAQLRAALWYMADDGAGNVFVCVLWFVVISS